MDPFIVLAPWAARVGGVVVAVRTVRLAGRGGSPVDLAATMNTDTPVVAKPEVEDAFDRPVGQGEVVRPGPALISTGLVGGINIGTGVLA